LWLPEYNKETCTDVAVKIKLKRIGKIRIPQYRIVVADARTRRGGRAIEEVGQYRPKEDPSFIKVESDRVQHWLSVGAQPTEAVAAILKITGDWQKFKGLPGTEGTLRVAADKTDKKAVFDEAAKSAEAEPARLKELQAKVAEKAAKERAEQEEAEAKAKAKAKAAAAPAESGNDSDASSDEVKSAESSDGKSDDTKSDESSDAS
jgi:small subunit ribosomal protein S16